MDHHEHMGNHRPPSLQKLPKRSNASHRPFPVVTFPLGRWNELCKSDRVTTLPRNSPMASDFTQNKNPRAVRPSMLWLLSTTPPSTSNLLHFVLSALVGPAFLLFLQHTKLVLNEPDPDSWSLHLLFLCLEFLLHWGFCFPQKSLLWPIYRKALSQSPSLPLLCSNFSKYLCPFFTLQTCSFLVFSNKI